MDKVYLLHSTMSTSPLKESPNFCMFVLQSHTHRMARGKICSLIFIRAISNSQSLLGKAHKIGIQSASTGRIFDKRMEVEQEAKQPSVRCQNWFSGFLKAVISPRRDSRPDPGRCGNARPWLSPCPLPPPATIKLLSGNSKPEAQSDSFRRSVLER